VENEKFSYKAFDFIFDSKNNFVIEHILNRKGDSSNSYRLFYFPTFNSVTGLF
jgi:hypothetical protein